jgi:hypothetical protein
LGQVQGADIQSPVRLAQEGEDAASINEVGVDDLLGEGLDELGVHAAGQVFLNAVSFADVEQHARVDVEPQGGVFVGVGADQREAGVDAVRFFTAGQWHGFHSVFPECLSGRAGGLALVMERVERGRDPNHGPDKATLLPSLPLESKLIPVPTVEVDRAHDPFE